MSNWKIVLILLLVCVAVRAQSQSLADEAVVANESATAKTNEAILSLSYAGGGINFGLLYKRQVAEKRFFRMSLADISFNRTKDSPRYSNQFPTSRENFSANLNLGVEWRFRVHEKIQLYTGIDAVAGAAHYANRVYDPSLPRDEQLNQDFRLRAGLAFNSGILINVHEMIRIGLNLSPDVLYSWSPWDYQDETGQTFKGQSHGVNTSIGTGAIQAQVIFHWKSGRKKKVSE